MFPTSFEIAFVNGRALLLLVKFEKDTTSLHQSFVHLADVEVSVFADFLGEGVQLPVFCVGLFNALSELIFGKLAPSSETIVFPINCEVVFNSVWRYPWEIKNAPGVHFISVLLYDAIHVSTLG